jgi:tripartite-type tricarboxylate transporter receptor subunit TctC
VGSSDAVALAPNFYPKLGYKPDKDLQPIAIVAEMPLVLMVKADSPITSLKDLIRRAKADPGSITYGTPGRGSSPHLMGVLLAKGAGIELSHIPYKGTAPAITDLFGGHVAVVVTSGFDSVPLEKAGRVRTLAVTGTKRYPLLPATPTIHVDDLMVWFGLFAPAGIPRPIVDRLSREIDDIVAKDEYKNRAAELGFVPIRTTPDKFMARMRSDMARLASMVNRTGVKPE